MKSDFNFKNLVLPSVRIVKTTPKVSEEQLFSYERCYFGISLDNPHFSGKSLQALLLWGVSNFEQCLVLVGDYLRRYNERILKGSKDDEAEKVAHELGDVFMRKTNEFFHQLPGKRVTVTRWKPCLQSSKYKKTRAILDELFASDADFRESVEKDAFSFVRRQTKRNQKFAVSPEEAAALSCEYLLEEIAVFSALSEQGWKVELYPGPELNVLIEIANGKYQNVPQGLRERVNVELHIRGSKAQRV